MAAKLTGQSTKELLLKARKIIPPLLESFHKGQMGRVGVIGGSEDYTGAPYFSAMASARLGTDMSHVICEPQAAQVIKTYSPNIMVHPLMRSQKHLTEAENFDDICLGVVAMLSRLHVIVIGPGLGRDELMQETCARVITEARKKGLPFVLDADGLHLAQTRPELVQGYKECILTPNIVEFGRLAKSKGIDMDGDQSLLCAKLATAFGGITIIQKGGTDLISDGSATLTSDMEGGLKRSGGQGDTLTGALATFLGWRNAYHERIWDHENDLSKEETLTLCAFAGSSMTRECSRLAFAKHGRSLQASDLTGEVRSAFLNIFGEKGSKI